MQQVGYLNELQGAKEKKLQKWQNLHFGTLK
jgi:hypothetical protein